LRYQRLGWGISPSAACVGAAASNFVQPGALFMRRQLGNLSAVSLGFIARLPCAVNVFAISLHALRVIDLIVSSNQKLCLTKDAKHKIDELNCSCNWFYGQFSRAGPMPRQAVARQPAVFILSTGAKAPHWHFKTR
jgi:hypothetical protein